MITTFHTYPDLVTEASERKAATVWGSRTTPSEALAYLANTDNQAIVLRVRHGETWYNGLMPGGIG
jgi:hypothetical protein